MSAPLRVLVVGGGIGGLAVAGALHRVGAAVTVVEQTAHWRPAGAGLVLSANALAVLEALGVERVAQHSTPLPAMEIRDHADRLLQRVAASAAPRAIRRAALHDLLRVYGDGVELRVGERLLDFEHTSDGVDVRQADGRRERYDLLVGADGLHSQIRTALLQARRASEVVRYAGYTCWRIEVANDVGLDRAIEYWGPGQRVGLVPLPEGRLYVFLTANCAAGGADHHDAPHAQIASAFAGFGGVVVPVLSSIATAHGTPLLRHDIYDLTHTVWGRDRVVLLGDAAHATTPNLGQGAAMALEDALALSTALRRTGAVDDALASFRRERDGRVARIVNMSRQIGAMAQWSHPVMCAVRNALVRHTPAWVNDRTMHTITEPGLALARRAASVTVR